MIKGVQAFIRWRDAEVASALENVAPPCFEEDRQVRIDLEKRLQISQNNLQSCEKHLQLVQKNERKVIDHCERLSAELEQANADLVSVKQARVDDHFVEDELKKVGVFLLRQNEEVVWRQLVCDVEKDPRWAQVQQTNSAQYEHRVFDNTFHSGQNSNAKYPLVDAVAAIDTLLDGYCKHTAEKHVWSLRFKALEEELEHSTKDIDIKACKIAELEATIAFLRGEKPTSDRLMYISPTQLLKDHSSSSHNSPVHEDLSSAVAASLVLEGCSNQLPDFGRLLNAVESPEVQTPSSSTSSDQSPSSPQVWVRSNDQYDITYYW